MSNRASYITSAADYAWDSGKDAEQSKRSEQRKGEKNVQPADKVLPLRSKTRQMGRWRTPGCPALKADVLEHGGSLPISDLSTRHPENAISYVYSR